MTTELLPRIGTITEIDDDFLPRADEFDLDDSGAMPPIFGKCPVCNKPLFPRDRFTGEMKAPPVGKGYESRAKCSGCGAIIFYQGDGNWGVLTNDMLTDDDRTADRGE